MRSFIIHLSTATARRGNVDLLLKRLPNAEVVDAANGQGPIPLQLEPGNAFTPHYPFPMRASEIGCYLSHRACWQKIVDDGLEGALITEDDLCLDDRWEATLDLLTACATPDHFIRLPAKDRETPIATLHSRGNVRLFLPKIIGLQAIFQYVGRNAAERLLDASKICDRPIDTFLQMHWVHGQQIHTILPNGAREATQELGGSTIQVKSRTGLLKREWRRFAYRRAVSVRPQSS